MCNVELYTLLSNVHPKPVHYSLILRYTIYKPAPVPPPLKRAGELCNVELYTLLSNVHPKPVHYSLILRYTIYKPAPVPPPLKRAGELHGNYTSAENTAC